MTRRRQPPRPSGAVALELALSLPLLFTALTYLLFCGRVLYNYEVVQKATRDSARYLSGVPAMNLKNAQLATQEVALATSMLQEQMSAISPGPGNIAIAISCDGFPCSALFNTVPANVTVSVTVNVQVGFSSYVDNLTAIPVRASHSMRYVGN